KRPGMAELPGIVDVRRLPRGPAGWLRYRELFACLVARNLKTHYGGVRRVSLLGLALAQLTPLFIVGVYAWVGRGVLKIPVEHYVLFLAVGHLHWTLFTTVLSRSCG